LTEIFYPQREDSTTDLRVHPIPGVAVYDDLTTGFKGLTYSDDHNSGVAIDGVPDAVDTSHLPAWQMVSGAAGSLVTTRSLDTSIAGLASSTYYLDQKPASPVPCTGDDTAWGQNGVQVVSPSGLLPCTDPTICANADTLSSTRVRYFEGPDLDRSTAATLATHANQPLDTTVSG
jgi:hypothetical protein